MDDSSETFDGEDDVAVTVAANHTRLRTFCVLKTIMRYSPDQMRTNERTGERGGANAQCMRLSVGIESTQIIKWTFCR